MRAARGDGRADAAWQKRGYDLDFGAGIALGYATCGEVGFEGRSDYAAIGAVTNLASRLADEATAGQILIAQRLYAEVEDDVEREPAGEFTLKGFRRPVAAFNVIPSAAAGELSCMVDVPASRRRAWLDAFSESGFPQLPKPRAFVRAPPLDRAGESGCAHRRRVRFEVAADLVRVDLPHLPKHPAHGRLDVVPGVAKAVRDQRQDLVAAGGRRRSFRCSARG